MRIVWLSNHPKRKTGYGRQTGIWARALQAAGHDVVIVAFTEGVEDEWHGIPVWPGGPDRWGMDLIRGHYQRWKADLLFTLMDTWVINPYALAGSGMNMACWTPVDCDPLGAIDKAMLQVTGARPVAMSRHGEAALKAAGLDPLYCPHAIDTDLFRPASFAGRAALKESAGLGKRFVVGMNAANTDKSRKGFDEAFQAFAAFRERHREAFLMVHTAWRNEEHGDGLDLQALADHRGIAGAVAFTDPGEYFAGRVTDAEMVKFYNRLDVFLNPARGEGFGIPIIEAQACGVPVIVTQASSMPELCGAGWPVAGQKSWAWLHRADWVVPSVPALTGALERARGGAGQLRQRARKFAEGYDIGRVMAEHMGPVLAELGSSSQ